MQSDAALQAVFFAATEQLAGIERRKMFGYPAVFLNGNMVAGLHRDGMVMRLGAEELRAMIDDAGATPFVAMGRTMRGWVVVPPAMLDRTTELAGWLTKALVYAGTLPPKAAKRKGREKLVR